MCRALRMNDTTFMLQGTKHSKKLEANGFAEPKRALENGVKSAHDTVASATAHTKAAHLPSDSKIAQMSSKPMAHVEAKGEPARAGAVKPHGRRFSLPSLRQGAALACFASLTRAATAPVHLVALCCGALARHVVMQRVG